MRFLDKIALVGIGNHSLSLFRQHGIATFRIGCMSLDDS